MNIDKNDLIKYYNTHTFADTCKYFNLNSDYLNRYLAAENLLRSVEDEKIARYLKYLSTIGVENPYNLIDLIIDFTVIPKTTFEISKQFNISEKTVKTLSKYFESIHLRKKNSDDRKQRMFEKYGVYNNFQRQICKEKIKETCLKRYGVEYISQSNQFKEKVKQICLDKYGTEYAIQSQDVQEKIKKTCLEKYGVDNPMKSDKIKNKLKQTKLAKYGDENYNNREKAQNTMIERYGVKSYPESHDFDEKTQRTSLEKYGVPYNCMRDEARSFHTKSKLNLKFGKLFEADSYEFVLNNYQYDLKKDNILIEIDPTYTHNSTYSWFGRDPLDKNYHLLKTKNAEENGYRCIHVFDWDDVDKIQQFFKSKIVLYARKCTIKEVSIKETNEFLNLYHLQNTCKGQNIRLGLYSNNKLIQIMTFGKPRYNKNYEYELLRLCTKTGYSIVGGAEKLFKYFLNIYKPLSIISYCDKSKFIGKIYSNLGFMFKEAQKPSKHWYNMKTKQHITDNLLRQRGFDQLFGTNYGKNTNNEKLMKENNFLEVYDCGQAIYIYINS